MSEEVKTFEGLGLSEASLAAIGKKGFESPTPIQRMAIPVLLGETCDVIGQAQTGTGKTAAFGLPILESIDVSLAMPQALVLAPTRELALQVADELTSLRGDGALQVLTVYGGQSISEQLRRLSRGAHIVVGTPGDAKNGVYRGCGGDSIACDRRAPYATVFGNNAGSDCEACEAIHARSETAGGR